MIKKVLKYLLLVFGVLVLGIIILGFVINEAEPNGQTGAEADRMATAMMQAVDKPGWDTTRYISWTFAGINNYLWDKTTDQVRVKWEEYEVLLDTKTQKGTVKKEGQTVTGAEAEKARKKAWSSFCNDSFWLNPTVKAFDSGTERSVVTLKDGQKGLKIKYTSGGVTPGDAYVWILDDQYQPTSWKMWVQIIPIGGIENTWEGWVTLPTGAKIATHHSLMGRKVEMIQDLKAGMSLAEMDIMEAPFE